MEGSQDIMSGLESGRIPVEGYVLIPPPASCIPACDPAAAALEDVPGATQHDVFSWQASLAVSIQRTESGQSGEKPPGIPRYFCQYRNRF